MEFHFEEYKVNRTTGWVLEEPLEFLPPYFDAWNCVAKNIRQVLARGNVRASLEQIPLLGIENLVNDHKMLRLGHLQMTTLVSAYVWCDGDSNVPKVLPENLAVPFWNLCTALGIEPGIAPHVTLALANYKKKCESRSLNVENMEMLYFKFVEDYGNDWFFLLTTQLELDFAKALPTIIEIIDASKLQDLPKLESHLLALSEVITTMDTTLRRMSENLTANVFFNGFRPYLAGTTSGLYEKWGGIVLQGVDDIPRKMGGGSAAQSPSIQCLDACLNVMHDDANARYLFDVRNYMLPEHRKLVEYVETNSKVRAVIEANPFDSLIDAYNSCLQKIVVFRSHHIQTVSKFISIPREKQRIAETSGSGCAYKSLYEIGTGGTGIMPFLKGIRDSTSGHLL